MSKFRVKIILLLQVVWLTACITDFKSNNLPFDSEKWKSGDIRAKGIMANSLQESKILIGKTKSEVEDLLGKNETPNYPDSCVYEIDFGYAIGFNTWTNSFKVLFDEQTKRVRLTYIGE